MFVSKKLHKVILEGLNQRIQSLLVEVGELKAKLTNLEQLAMEERARTDRAIDRLLLSTGTPPISQPAVTNEGHLDNIFEEDPAVVSELRKNIEEYGPGNVLLGSNE